jgi:hypothetical protein
MPSERDYQVRWVVAPHNPDGTGLYGTTMHSAKSAATAALRSAESVARVMSEEDMDGTFHVLSVTGEESGPNLLSADQLRAALRYHPHELPLEVLCRPLC